MTIKQRLVSDEIQTVSTWTIGQQTIFTVLCLVARPLNENEAGGEAVACLVAWSLNDYEAGAAHVLIETSRLLRTA